METRGEAQVWRVWVNAEERVVSFHQDDSHGDGGNYV